MASTPLGSASTQRHGDARADFRVLPPTISSPTPAIEARGRIEQPRIEQDDGAAHARTPRRSRVSASSTAIRTATPIST